MSSFPTPESVVRTEPMGPHFTKYHLAGGGLLHHFTRAEDEHYHDHPWGFTSHVLSGGYIEELAVVTDDGELAVATIERAAGTSHQVQSGTVHKLIGLIGTDCWTLVEPGQKEREPGFYRADDAGVWHRYWYEQDWRLLTSKLAILA